MKVQSKLGVTIPVPHKVYTALLTQSGTDAPVATVLENTLGGTVVWTRAGVGEYIGTLAGAFPLNKCSIGNGDGDSGVIMYTDIINQQILMLSRVSVNTIKLTQFDSYFLAAATDGIASAVPVEIKVYP